MKKTLKELLLNIAINGAILFIIHTLIPELGFKVLSSKYGSIITFVILGAVFRFLNMVVKKILKVITLPLKYLTFGLSSIVLNIAIFYIFEILLRSMDVGIQIQLGGVIEVLILSIIITIVYVLVKKII